MILTEKDFFLTINNKLIKNKKIRIKQKYKIKRKIRKDIEKILEILPLQITKDRGQPMKKLLVMTKKKSNRK